MTAAELIGRVSVEGEGSYNAAMRRMGHITDQFAQNVAQSIRTIGALSGLVGAGGFLGLGFSAFKAANDVQQLRETLITLTGSAEAADRKLDFVRKLAIPATLTNRQLREAGVQLEAMNVKLERGLPLISKLAAAFNVTDKGTLDELTRAIGMIRSGHLPELEVRARFGISNQDLIAQGVRFDKNGQLLSSAEETFTAFERMIDRKYPNILEKMSKTTNSKLASIQDRWENAMVRIGNVLERSLTPALEKVAKIMDRILGGDRIERVVKGIVNAFSALRPIAMAVAGVIGFIASYKTIMAFIQLGVAVVAFARAMAAAAAAGTLLSAISGGLKAVIPTLIAVALAGVVAFAGMAAAEKAMEKIKGALNMALETTSFKPDEIPSGGGGSPFTGENSPLGQIATNTAKIAANTDGIKDLKRYVVGGGPLAQIGVTPVELNRARRGAPKLTVDLKGVESFSDIVAKTILQMQRQGLLAAH